MLKDTTQITMDLSPYQGLYEAIIPQDHILRKLKDNIDFSFANPMLRKQCCEHFGRPAKGVRITPAPRTAPLIITMPRPIPYSSNKVVP